MTLTVCDILHSSNGVHNAWQLILKLEIDIENDIENDRQLDNDNGC